MLGVPIRSISEAGWPVAIQNTTLELGPFIAALTAEVLVILLGLIAMSGAVSDVLAAVAQLPSRANDKDDETNEMTSRKQARCELVHLVFFRSLPGFLLVAVGLTMICFTVWPSIHRL